jgi:hypothetical protein
MNSSHLPTRAALSLVPWKRRKLIGRQILAVFPYRKPSRATLPTPVGSDATREPELLHKTAVVPQLHPSSFLPTSHSSAVDTPYTTSETVVHSISSVHFSKARKWWGL